MRIIKNAYSAVIFVAVLASLPIKFGMATEFIPYELPSQKYQRQAPSTIIEQKIQPKSIAIPVKRRKVPDAVYKDFNNKVKNLSPKSKDELSKAFNAKRNKAIENGDLEQVKYYNTLIKMLQTR